MKAGKGEVIERPITRPERPKSPVSPVRFIPVKDSNGIARVPLLKMNMGKMELVAVLLLAVLVTLDVEEEEELTFTETEGAVLLVIVVLERLSPDSRRPRSVPRTRKTGRRVRKMGVKSTSYTAL